MVGARVASVAVIFGVILAAGALSVPARVHWPVVALAGAADIVANVLFVVAVRGSLLILASVLVSLYPASTLILARVVLGERTTALQRFGLVLGTAAVVAISLG